MIVDWCAFDIVSSRNSIGERDGVAVSRGEIRWLCCSGVHRLCSGLIWGGTQPYYRVVQRLVPCGEVQRRRVDDVHQLRRGLHVHGWLDVA